MEVSKSSRNSVEFLHCFLYVLHPRVNNGTDKNKINMLSSTSSQKLGISIWLAALSSTFIGQLCSRLLQSNVSYLNKTPHNRKINALE